MPTNAWDDGTIDQLRALWKEGHTTTEIGRRLGFTKNAVIGKAHRLDLSARPSPIQRGFKPRTTVMAAQIVRSAPPVERPRSGFDHAPTRTTVASVPAAAPVIPARRFIVRRTVDGNCPSCLWPIGEPGTAAYRTCDAPAEAGRPYCEAHCGVAYVRRKTPAIGSLYHG